MNPGAFFAGVAAAAITAQLGGGGPSPTWLTMWQTTAGQNAISGFTGRTLRVRIPREVIGVNGSKVRVTFRAGGEAMTIPNAFIGYAPPKPPVSWALETSAEEPWDYLSTPTRLTFDTGNNSSGSISAGATKLSDEIDFVVDGSDDLVVSFHNSDDDAPRFSYGANANGAQGWYHGTTGDDAATVDARGYTWSEVPYAVHGLVKIEVLGFDGSPGGVEPLANYPIDLTLTNPGAESGNMTGWTTNTGSVSAVQAGGGPGHPTPFSGTWQFTFGSGNTHDFSQTIDLTAHAEWADIEVDIANGIVRATNFCHQRSFSSGDRGRCSPYLKFLDSSDAVIREVRDQDVFYTSYVEQLAADIVPAGTEKIVIGYVGTRIIGVGEIRTYVDACQLVLNFEPLRVEDPYSNYTVAHFAADDGVGVDWATKGVLWSDLDEVESQNVGGSAGRVLRAIASAAQNWDGASDSLFNVEARDWTYQGYFKFPSATYNQQDFFVYRGNTSFGGRQSIRFGPVNGFWSATLRYSSADNTITSGIQVAADVEHHIALVRHGATIYLYFDGVSTGTPLNVGTASIQIPGSVDTRRLWLLPAGGTADAVVFNNGVCLYPGGTTFTPPTRPLARPTRVPAPVHDNFDDGSKDALWDNVQALVKMVGTDESTTQSDSSQAARTVTLSNGAKIDDAVTLFGSNMGYVDGSNDFVSIARGSGFWGASESLCFEGHFYFPSFAATGDRFIMGQYRSVTNGRGIALHRNSTNFIVYYGTSSGSTGTALITVAHGMVINTLYHLAVTRDVATNTYRLYKDGVMLAKVTNSNALHLPSQDFTIGGQADGATQMQEMRFGDIRITTGNPRYNWDDGFTPPAARFSVTD